MKLLLIKAGKAYNTLRRDGVIRGGKRVSSAFFALFGKVGKGDILFVTGGVGDSARYRAGHVAEELELQGFRCSITVQDNPFLSGYADKFRIFIFHRTLFTPSVARLIKRIKAQGKEIIFETDDLVYDPKFLVHMDYFLKMNVFERKLYENGVGGEILDDPYVKVCTTTTTYLADKLREKGKEIFLVPNRLCREDIETAEMIISDKKQESDRKQAGERIDGTVKIGYFSGTISHNKDFATVTDALMLIMGKYPQVQLLLAGPLDVDNKLNAYMDRIKQVPYVPRKEHFANVAGVDINISPLEIGNPFCESKSELKFFEAAIVEVPTVAAATRTFCEAIDAGVDGFVADSTTDWFDKLERLVTNEALRKEMGEKARLKALVRYATINAKNEQYHEYLRKCLTENNT